jgi:hypothetical protein
MTFCPFTNRIPYGLLTDEEKKILEAEGPWIRVWPDQSEQELTNFCWTDLAIWRRKKVPVIRRVEMYTSHPPGPWGHTADTDKDDRTHKITFNIIDGVPDLTSIKMEEL